jgi:hypothetical protein
MLLLEVHCMSTTAAATAAAATAAAATAAAATAAAALQDFSQPRHPCKIW